MGLQRRLFCTEKTCNENDTLPCGQEQRYVCERRDGDDYRSVTERDVEDDLKTPEKASGASVLAVKVTVNAAEEKPHRPPATFDPSASRAGLQSEDAAETGDSTQGQIQPRGPGTTPSPPRPRFAAISRTRSLAPSTRSLHVTSTQHFDTQEASVTRTGAECGHRPEKLMAGLHFWSLHHSSLARGRPQASRFTPPSNDHVATVSFLRVYRGPDGPFSHCELP